MAHLRQDLSRTQQKLATKNQSRASPPARSNSSGGDAGGGDISEFWGHVLEFHNDIRRKHGLQELVWDENLVPDATAQATDCEVQNRHFHGHQNGAVSDSAIRQCTVL